MSVFIGITQRVDRDDCYGERRDGIDQRWFDFLALCGVVPVPLPNHLRTVQLLLERIDIDGFILSGGGDLVAYGGDAPKRDEVERFLIALALRRQVPLLGVCRGMQAIQDYFGVGLHPVQGHIATTHMMNSRDGVNAVNSYHKYGTTGNVPELIVTARAEDGVVEAIRHKSCRVAGIMWHPERQLPYAEQDQYMIRQFFAK